MCNQRTSGPVNAHLTPGPYIYVNAFTHVYSPRGGADNPLGTNVDVNRKHLTLCPFLASFKMISSKSDFIHIFNDFIHIYSPGARADNLLGTNFWCQQKSLITLPICCRFKQIALKSDLIYMYFIMFHHMYIAPGRGRQSIGDKILMTAERPFLFAHMLQVSKWSLRNLIFIHIFNDFIQVYSPGTRAENPLGTNFWCQQKALITSTICCKFQTNLFEFWFYTFFNVFPHVYSPGAGVDNRLWTKSWCQQKSLVTLPICCKFQKYLWCLILYIYFHVFIHVYITTGCTYH